MPEWTSPKIPVTVLTGYLGAGKTTLLNRILSENHGKKYAVIVNEFGEIGIDNDLIIGADEEIFEMNNGCICCTVRGDLVRILDGLMKRKGKFDAIIVETTGLADPAPGAQTFFVDEDVQKNARLDGVGLVAGRNWLKSRRGFAASTPTQNCTAPSAARSRCRTCWREARSTSTASSKSSRNFWKPATITIIMITITIPAMTVTITPTATAA